MRVFRRTIRVSGMRHRRAFGGFVRVRVVEAVDEGATRHEAAERFGVSVSSAVRWHQAWRHEGTIEAKPVRRKPLPLEDYAGELLALVKEQPDLTLDEIVAVMRNKDTRKPHGAVSFLERHAVRRKKSFALPNRSGQRGSRPPAMDTRAGLA